MPGEQHMMTYIWLSWNIGTIGVKQVGCAGAVVPIRTDYSCALQLTVPAYCLARKQTLNKVCTLIFARCHSQMGTAVTSQARFSIVWLMSGSL